MFANQNSISLRLRQSKLLLSCIAYFHPHPPYKLPLALRNQLPSPADTHIEFRNLSVWNYICGGSFQQGDHYNWSKEECDSAFLRDMKTLCERNHASKKSCLFTSSLYYRAVVLAGRFFYRKPSMKFCFESCVKKYGDPRIGV
jgi:hypothetical protein